MDVFHFGCSCFKKGSVTMSEVTQNPIVAEKQVQPRIANMDFVKAYHAVESYEELASKLGLSPDSVASRASKLRKLGVILPPFKRASKGIDVAALNALAPPATVAAAIEKLTAEIK